MSTRCKHGLILAGACFIFLVFGNGYVSLTGHDETFYAQTAREMAARGEWLTPYLFGQPQFEKPILLYVCLRLAGLTFGFNSFSMRLFPALFATLGIAGVYLLGLGFGDERKAFLSALILSSSLLFVGLARTVFTDMIFCVLILLALTGFYWGYLRPERRRVSILLFFAFSGFAVLTKGPLGILLPSLVVLSFLALRRDLKAYRRPSVWWGLLLFALIAVPWYAVMIARFGRQFTHEFFYNDHWRRIVEAEHRRFDTWYFYPVGTIACMFPWSLFVVGGCIHTCRRMRCAESPMPLFLGMYVLVIFLVFQAAHSKLLSYVFPAFPALALMTANWLVDAESPTGWRRRGLLLAAGTTCAVLLTLVPAILVVGHREFGIWLSTRAVERVGLLIAFAASACVGIAHVSLLARGRVLKASYALTLTVPIVLLIISAVASRVEPYISASAVCSRFLEKDKGSGTVLCAKSLVRAVRYYTGCDVAVLAIGGRGFFSPHPIPLLTDEEQAKAFLRQQDVTYCIVKQPEAQALERMAAGSCICTNLATVGDVHIIAFERQRKENNNATSFETPTPRGGTLVGDEMP